MKASDNHGFSYKACMVLQTFVAIIFVGLFLSLYSFSEKSMTSNCDQRVESKVNRIRMRVHKELAEVELCANMFADGLLQEGAQLLGEEDMFNHMETFLKTTSRFLPSITGVVAGFEDDVYPDCQAEWGFIPLIRLVDSTQVRYQMGEVRDVRHVNDWYAGTKATDQARWSKVMMSEDGEPICNYSIPLHDKEGHFIGALAVDLSLAFLTEDLYESLPFPDAEVSIIDSSHTYLVNRNLSYVMNKTSYEYLAEMGIDPDPATKDDIDNRRAGKHLSKRNTARGIHEVFLYYSPIENTDWTILLNMPVESAYTDLSSMRQRMILTGLVGLLLVIVVAMTFTRFRR